ncbi:hypothetical protein DMA15_22155 [Streptomyces sp. WAC 01529]|uniref:hypothetical protein n=1 Tax=Streptomyces sp. WAC 01529 TaxID=2203205 RepID=UPI000F6F9F37|nr:hypothetical protein [Streptomyces sp. WAC 01529]AZM54932.1 hypothetical protein DMA15_22155 [Streptomyces sp. WAC 01529]
MPASERDVQPRPPHVLPGPVAVSRPAHPSMSELLASCAAATAVSTPPRDPAPRAPAPAGSTPTERRRPSC